jgi:dipeptidyl aminopeptidase/acylaminoacyl peptidase
MVRLEDTSFISGNSSTAHFSPDGTRFVVVIRKGNLEQKTNDFSLLLYSTADALHSPKPDVLLTLSSTSARDAVTRVQWLPDSETLVFLGEKPDEKPQVYKLSVKSKKLTQLTDHRTTIYDYAIDDEGDGVVFRAASPSMDSINDGYPQQSSLKQVVVNGQELISLLGGTYSPPEGQHIFWKSKGHAERQVPTGKEYFIPWGALSLSPNGRYIIFPVFRRTAPHEWADYRDEHGLIPMRLSQKLPPLSEYLVADTATLSVHSLVGAPVLFPTPISWAKDSAAVFLSSYLPLDVSDPVEREARRNNQYRIQLTLPSGAYKRLSPEDSTAAPVAGAPLDISLVQDVNTPPRLYATEPKSGQKELLLNLNPQFDALQLGSVKTIEWEVDGIKVIGGLYSPPDYVPHKRYPLVIQTHGYDPNEFSMDGFHEYSNGFAARPLAAKGILVLQLQGFKNQQDRDNAVVAKNRKLGATWQESLKNWTARVYADAIEALDKQGIIDRSRVGIVGFSATVCYVGYTLTHSQFRFAAASLVDGISCGYFEEIEFPDVATEFNAYNGNVAPFGDGLATWMRNAPGFNLDKVQAPVRLVALGNFSLFSQWEWYVGLTFQKKPVDFVLIPHGIHLGGMVSERMLEQQGLVDWFTFWLKGEEDPDPAKAEQYARWRELRKLQEANEKKSVAPAN